MWRPEPLTAEDARELAVLAAAVACDHVRWALQDGLPTDPRAGLRHADAMSFWLEATGGPVLSALLEAGLVLAGDLVGRWPEPVRAAGSALREALGSGFGHLVVRSPVVVSELLEVLRPAPMLAELISQPDPATAVSAVRTRAWADNQLALIVAARA